MFINKVIDHHKNSSVWYRTPKPNVRKFHCNEYFEEGILLKNLLKLKIIIANSIASPFKTKKLVN